MKPLKKSIILMFIIAAFLCVGSVTALDQNQATVQPVGLTEILQAGQTVQIRLFFTSTSAEALQVRAVGIHFDWMQTVPSDQYAGYTLPTPVAISAGGGSYLFEAITITIPTTASNGPHTYYVAIDGTEGASTPFSWNSPTASVTVTGGSASTTTPTPTNSNGQPGAQPDLLMYGAIAAVVVVVGLLLALVLLRRKRAKPKPVAKQGEAEPLPPTPTEGPEQDFDI